VTTVVRLKPDVTTGRTARRAGLDERRPDAATETTDERTHHE
jgi:hypothetical protein